MTLMLVALFGWSLTLAAFAVGENASHGRKKH